MKEHNLQKAIHECLDFNGIMHIQTDVMDGLKFCKTLQTRMAFINHHKQMGYIKGQSDIIIILPSKVVFVEIKNGKAGRQSAEQKAFQKMVEELGHEYMIWRDIGDCVIFCEKNKKRC